MRAVSGTRGRLCNGRAGLPMPLFALGFGLGGTLVPARFAATMKPSTGGEFPMRGLLVALLAVGFESAAAAQDTRLKLDPGGAWLGANPLRNRDRPGTAIGGVPKGGIDDTARCRNDGIEATPALVDSRIDGVAGFWDSSMNNGDLVVDFYRYKSDDALCCPSELRKVTYRIAASPQGPVLTPMSVRIETPKN
ncbi:MAG: hypothetical protein AB7G15_05390 [Alphaproteobacteria bacterium]